MFLFDCLVWGEMRRVHCLGSSRVRGGNAVSLALVHCSGSKMLKVMSLKQ